MASGTFHGSKLLPSSTSKSELANLVPNWEDVICPICLDFPHNGVLLQCTSYGNGCQPFMCDTDHTYSNCLDRFKSASGIPVLEKDPSTPDATSVETAQPMELKEKDRPACPLCRGEVTGWVVLDEVRLHLNKKKRCCDHDNCAFVGNYPELQKHAQIKHPHALPSKIDPARQLDWENFQQSSEIIDVLSIIHSEVPHGIVLGDYVIEYGDDDNRDEYEDFPGDDGNRWTSCILYQVFDNFRASRNRRRERVSETTRGRRRSSYEASTPDDGSMTSVEIGEYRADETDDEYMSSITDTSRGNASHRRSVKHVFWKLPHVLKFFEFKR